MSQYVHTRFGLCPECFETSPGHVYSDDLSGEAGWKCPYPTCQKFTHVDDMDFGPVVVPPRGSGKPREVE